MTWSNSCETRSRPGNCTRSFTARRWATTSASTAADWPSDCSTSLSGCTGSRIMANVLLGVTGSVAAVRTPELHRALTQAGHAVKVVATRAARYFFDADRLKADGATLF